METITTTNLPVQFTATAIQEIKRLIAAESITPTLRRGVKGGGCSGMTYVLEFDSKQEGDRVYETDGFSFVMNAAHEMYVQNMEVDFGSGLNDRGFVFKNPNASKTCGCGTSFAV